MLKNKIKYFYLIFYLLIISIITIIYIIDDFYNSLEINNTLIKYYYIIIINIFSIINFIIITVKEKRININSLFLTIGLFFTLVSDTFLLLLDDYYLIGVSAFIVVQSSYFVKLMHQINFNKKRFIVSFISRIAVFIISLFIVKELNMLSLLNVITDLYFISLVFNFIDAFINYLKNKNTQNLLFCIGLFLFVGCDISVGCYNLFDTMFPFIWLCYGPSQVLLSLSIINFKKGALYEC